MRANILFIFISVVFMIDFGPAVLASEKDECTFMVEANRQIQLDPNDLAQANFENNKIFFYSVGTGFAGIVPCFENPEEFSCVNKFYKIDLIWVGGDVISCEGQSELEKKVTAWAKKYNCRLKSLLIERNQYKCGM